MTLTMQALTPQTSEDLKRLARLAANITDAHTCAVLIPSFSSATTHRDNRSGRPSGSRAHLKGIGGAAFLEQATEFLGQATEVVRPSSHSSPIELRHIVDETPPKNTPKSIELAAIQTLSTHAVSDLRIQVGFGLLGWVAEQGRPIHISPFDLDTSTLGIYKENEAIRCLAAVPVPITLPSHASGATKAPPLFGVLMCDSKKAFSFSKIQIKHLEEIAPIIGRTISSSIRPPTSTEVDAHWNTFSTRTQRLADAIGFGSLELLRVSVANCTQLEEAFGVSGVVHRVDQFTRLVQQALPPHFPVIKIATAELLISVDNMMSVFFQSKIKLLADRLHENGTPFAVVISTYSSRGLKGKSFDIDAVLRQPVLNQGGLGDHGLANHSKQSVVSGGRRA